MGRVVSRERWLVSDDLWSTIEPLLPTSPSDGHAGEAGDRACPTAKR